MVPDRQKVRTDGRTEGRTECTDGQTHGRRQNYNPPTSSGDNRKNSSETEALVLDLDLLITNGIVSSKIYDALDDFDFEIVNFPFLDGDVPRSPSYGVYISQFIRFARVCSNVDEFNNKN